MDIDALYEEEDSLSIIGLWAWGHHTTGDFVNNANVIFDLEDKPINPRSVKHGWATRITDEEMADDFDYYIGFSEKPERNAVEATYFFYE